MSQQCKWCYSPATERAWSVRHAWHMLCQRHYEEARSAMKAWMIEKQYEPTCDICGVMQYADESLEWNGDTGNHVHCEEN